MSGDEQVRTYYEMFDPLAEVYLEDSGDPPAVDASGEQDYGHIDTFTPVGDDSSIWELTGDGGEASVTLPAVELSLDGRPGQL